MSEPTDVQAVLREIHRLADTGSLWLGMAAAPSAALSAGRVQIRTLARQALDALDAQQAEVQRLTAERDDYKARFERLLETGGKYLRTDREREIYSTAYDRGYERGVADRDAQVREAFMAWLPIETAPQDETTILRPHRIWGPMDVRRITNEQQLGTLSKGIDWRWLNGDLTTAWTESAFLPFWMPLPSVAALQRARETGR